MKKVVETPAIKKGVKSSRVNRAEIVKARAAYRAGERPEAAGVPRGYSSQVRVKTREVRGMIEEWLKAN